MRGVALYAIGIEIGIGIERSTFNLKRAVERVDFEQRPVNIGFR
jgi:hypothetical protein